MNLQHLHQTVNALQNKVTQLDNVRDKITRLSKAVDETRQHLTRLTFGLSVMVLMVVGLVMAVAVFVWLSRSNPHLMKNLLGLSFVAGSVPRQRQKTADKEGYDGYGSVGTPASREKVRKAATSARAPPASVARAPQAERADPAAFSPPDVVSGPPPMTVLNPEWMTSSTLQLASQAVSQAPAPTPASCAAAEVPETPETDPVSYATPREPEATADPAMVTA